MRILTHGNQRQPSALNASGGASISMVEEPVHVVEPYRATSRTERIGGSQPGTRRFVLRVLAIVATGIATMAASLIPNPASAGANAGPAPARLAGAGITTIVKHVCENFGATVSGYRAGHCAEVDIFVNSQGHFGVRGRSEVFCQRASDGVVVQCAGIQHNVEVRNLTTGENGNWVAEKRCGRYTDPAHSPACPSGRLTHLSAGIYAYCGHLYEVRVWSDVALPVSGAVQQSDHFTTTYRYPSSDGCL